MYRNVKRFPMAEEVAGIKIMRFDASLNFANWESFTTTLASLAVGDIHTVIVDASSINDIDTSSMRGLFNLIEVSCCFLCFVHPLLVPSFVSFVVTRTNLCKSPLTN